MEKNGTEEVFKFLQKNIQNSMRVFNLLCEFMTNKFEYNKLLEYLFALEKIKMQNKQKELIYKKIIDVSNIIQDNKVKNKYLHKINEVTPNLIYTLQICEGLSIEDQIKEIEQLSEKFTIEKEKDVDEKLLIELILGKIENVYIIFEKLDKYEKDSIENLIFYYLLAFGNKKNHKIRLLMEKLEEKIKNIESKLDADLIFKIMQSTRKEISKELIEKVEKQIKNKISKMTKQFLNTQQRGRYQEAADYLIAFIEYLNQQGREQEGKILLQKFQEEYRNYSVYKKCLKNALERSDIGE